MFVCMIDRFNKSISERERERKEEKMSRTLKY